MLHSHSWYTWTKYNANFNICVVGVQVEKMAPLSEGLLLERSTREETGSGLPTMFSLLSSTGDLSPIVTRQSFTHGNTFI